MDRARFTELCCLFHALSQTTLRACVSNLVAHQPNNRAPLRVVQGQGVPDLCPHGVQICAVGKFVYECVPSGRNALPAVTRSAPSVK